MSKCVGIFGMLFGHSFIETFRVNVIDMLGLYNSFIDFDNLHESIQYRLSTHVNFLTNDCFYVTNQEIIFEMESLKHKIMMDQYELIGE